MLSIQSLSIIANYIFNIIEFVRFEINVIYQSVVQREEHNENNFHHRRIKNWK